MLRLLSSYKTFTAIALFGIASVPAICTAQPIVQGLNGSELSPELKGRLLVQELNCVACHQSEAPFTKDSKKAPRLAAIGDRVNPSYLAEFIRDPHATKPGTAMPDVMGHLSELEKTQAAEAITHFLLSQKPNPDFSPQAPDLVAAEQGKTLFHSRGCVACHSPRDEKGGELLIDSSVPLGELDKKYSVKSLTQFLQRPHAVRPSGRMPDLRLQGNEYDRIAHYLLQKTQVPGHLAFTLYRGQVYEGLSSDTVSAEKAGQVDDFNLETLGNVQNQTAIEYEGWINLKESGAYTFHLLMNGGNLLIDGKEIVSEAPSNRRGPKNLQGSADLKAGLRKIELTYFHTGREAKFQFEMEGPQFERGPIPSSMLSVSDTEIPAFEALTVDSDLANRGRQYFGEMGCANCHNDLKVDAELGPAFSSLDGSRGCLSDAKGEWPHFDLSPEQTKLIAGVLPNLEQQGLNDEQQINTTLVRFNCIGCHEREGLGGISPERNEYFSGTHPELGDQGRLPPPLSHVGAKLTPEWIAEVLLHGKRQRNYVDASMPQYGEENVGHLVELFGKVDTLEEVTIPEVTNIRESKNAGYEMIGTAGFSCIACHDFNGQKSGGAGALDIVHVTERLQKNWFHLYMRNPARFHSTVIMPSYWPGGQSVRPDVLNGDSGQQIEALWAYLKDGTRAKKPEGLSRVSNEIRVTNVAEIARGRGTAGYRGIGVGYPERINLAFDSEEMALRLLWKGAFANINNGSFRASGGDKIAFPAGIPFYRLNSMDDNWPYKGKTDYTFPQNLGYQFGGYRLDKLRRPTFEYRYGDINVEDFFEDIPESKNGGAKFKRTFTFDSPEDQPLFYFRAASGKAVTAESDQSFTIDQLKLSITSDGHKGIVREGDPGEVLIPLTLPKGSSTLTLEYKW